MVSNLSKRVRSTHVDAKRKKEAQKRTHLRHTLVFLRVTFCLRASVANLAYHTQGVRFAYVYCLGSYEISFFPVFMRRYVRFWISFFLFALMFALRFRFKRFGTDLGPQILTLKFPPCTDPLRKGTWKKLCRP